MVRVVRAVGTVHILARGVDVMLEVVGICGGTMRGGRAIGEPDDVWEIGVDDVRPVGYSPGQYGPRGVSSGYDPGVNRTAVSSASAGSMFRYSAHCGGWDRDAYGYSGNERRRELKVKSLERGVFVLLFLGPSDFITRPEAWDVFPRKGHLGLRLP